MLQLQLQYSYSYLRGCGGGGGCQVVPVWDLKWYYHRFFDRSLLRS